MTERILFVDDEPDMEDLVRQRFRRQIKEGTFVFEFAGNGRTALAKLEAHPDIRLIVTDINMPEMDGLTLLGEVARLDRPIRTMVVSAYGDMQNIRAAMNRGAFDFVTKPIDFSDFEVTLEKTMQEIRHLLQAIDTRSRLGLETVERMKAQEEALRQAEENTRLVTEQKAILEQRVAERTRELAEKAERLKEEMRRSEELLLNILPYETAQELRASGKASARYYPDVTVMFTDFKGFTQIAEQLSPEEVVKELDEYFTAFDEITERWGLEKIKTIGDAYMAAGGLPATNSTHPYDVVRAALDIMQVVDDQRDRRRGTTRPVFDIRVGIHTGPVVAGIVGHKKFAYDIWGDTVNLASRMESAGETGCINISGATHERIQAQYACTARGEIEVKNKGRIGMYFVQKP